MAGIGVGPRHVVEKERHRHIEDLAELEQARGADAVDAALVFLDLLEGQAEALAEPLLAHAEQGTAQPQALADMDVDRVGLACHREVPRFETSARAAGRTLRAGADLVTF